MSTFLKFKKSQMYFLIVIGMVLFQMYMITRCPSGLGMESLLAAQAFQRGVLPYRDFQMHVGPVVPLLFSALFAVPPLMWCSLVFSLFNLLTAWGIFKLSRRRFDDLASYAAAALFLVAIPLFDGNAWHVETVMATFGVWAFYWAETGRKKLAALMVLLAVLTKQTGIIYALCFLG
jgi:uncharacterized membrane protein